MLRRFSVRFFPHLAEERGGAEEGGGAGVEQRAGRKGGGSQRLRNGADFACFENGEYFAACNAVPHHREVCSHCFEPRANTASVAEYAQQCVFDEKFRVCLMRARLLVSYMLRGWAAKQDAEWRLVASGPACWKTMGTEDPMVFACSYVCSRGTRVALLLIARKGCLHI